MKIGVGAMSELLRMFYDSLQAIQLTSDYMKAVLGKWNIAIRLGSFTSKTYPLPYQNFTSCPTQGLSDT